MSRSKGEIARGASMSAASAAHSLRVMRKAALDVLMPPQCMSYGASIEQHGGLCGSCWSDLSFIAGLVCDICGTPFELAAGPQAICTACAGERPIYHRARAALRYDDPARQLILAFKRGDRTEVAPLLATWLDGAGRELFAGADYLIPVPLHRWRLFQRRYNQSALLAIALAKRWGVGALPEGLVRIRATRSQTGLTRKGRRHNVRNVFDLGKHGANVISGRNIILIDDVMTKGATVSACAWRLAQGGENRIDVLTVARVVRGHSDAA